MNKEPTQEQIKEFWEWCGFGFYRPVKDGAVDVIYPDGSVCLSPSRFAVPPIDLNNLFKYAVPKLIGDEKYELSISSDVDCETRLPVYIVSFSDDPLYVNAEEENSDLALALFWAIWEVIHKG